MTTATSDGLCENKLVPKETKYHCKICNKFYASFKSYGNHVRSYHNKNKEKSQCPHCGNCFTRHDNLQQHIKLFHCELDKQFVCTTCHDVFMNKSFYLRHYRKCQKSRKGFSKFVKDVGKEQGNGRGPDSSYEDIKPIINNNCVAQESERVDTKDLVCSRSNTKVEKFQIIDSSPNYIPSLQNFVVVFDHNKDYQTQLIKSKENDGQVIENLNRRLREETLPERNLVQAENPIYPSSIKFKKQIDESGLLINNTNCNDCTMFNEGAEIALGVTDSCIALDCTICNITFLNKNDYENHKPYCKDIAIL